MHHEDRNVDEFEVFMEISLRENLEMHAATLPRCVEDLRDCRLEPGVRVGDDELDAAQASRVSERKKSVQNGSASLGPTATPRPPESRP